MSETIEGGIFKDAEGDGYHDANGNPVDAKKVAEAAKVKQPPVVTPVPVTPSSAPTPAVPADAVGPVTVETVQTIPPEDKDKTK